MSVLQHSKWNLFHTKYLFSCSDFEEEHNGHEDQDQLIYDVKNAELCEQIEDLDESFELVPLEDPSLVTGDDSDSSNTRPDSLNKTFT